MAIEAYSQATSGIGPGSVRLYLQDRSIQSIQPLGPIGSVPVQFHLSQLSVQSNSISKLISPSRRTRPKRDRTGFDHPWLRQKSRYVENLSWSRGLRIYFEG